MLAKVAKVANFCTTMLGKGVAALKDAGSKASEGSGASTTGRTSKTCKDLYGGYCLLSRYDW